jgi:hypothetical protein
MKKRLTPKTVTEHPEVATIEELYIADEQARWDPRDYWRMPLSYPRAS